jgi:hypothetical protein
MSSYTAKILWTRHPGADFSKGQYSRAHFLVIASAAKQSSSPQLDCRVASLLAMTGECG